MGSLDCSYEYLDWQHGDIGEGYPHSGLLNSYIMNPALTIGLSDYFNFTISKAIGIRIMDYNEVPGENQTPHHRDEGTHEPFSNVNEGIFGDARLLLRYLILNDGMQGNRLFIGTGLAIPSKNRLTKSPFLYDTVLNDEGQEEKIYPEHRHFAMSEGTYQWIGELQFFRKLTPPIIFWGVSTSIAYPISESKEGFLSPIRLDFSGTLLTQKIKFINAALGVYMQYKYSGAAQWNGLETKNSKGSVITPGFGFIWTTQNKLGIALNILFPQLLSGNLAMIESEPDQNLNAVQLSLGVRKTFDYIIPFLE